MTTLAIVVAVLLLALVVWRLRRPVPPLARQSRAQPSAATHASEEPPAAPTPEPAPDPAPAHDPVASAALEMARTAHSIAEHLGFEAMPDRKRPAIRKLRIALRNELERAAAERLAGGALACVVELTITRDARHAVALLDTAAPAPAATDGAAAR